MSPLSEQFSTVRKLQIETQLNFFRNVTGKAFESAEKLLALNLDTSRASLEQSSNLVRQLITAKNPRELFVLTSQTPSQFDSVLSYGRQLFGIAAGTASAAMRGADAVTVFVPAPVPATVSAPALAAPALKALVDTALVLETALIAEPAPAAEPTPAAEPAVVVAAVSAPTLVVEAKRAAEVQPSAPASAQPSATPAPVAASQPEAVKPSAASFPVPSSAQPIAVASVSPATTVAALPPATLATPVAATPPAVQTAAAPAVATAKAAAPAAKAKRKK